MLSELFEDDDDEGSNVNVSIVKDVFIPDPKPRKPAEPRAACNLAGLENQGATCYLNSLIQALYHTPELRSGLYEIDPLSLGADRMDEFMNVSNADSATKTTSSTSDNSGSSSSSSSSRGEFEVDEALLSQLANMGVNDFVAKRALVSTKNAPIEEVFEYITANETTLEKEAAKDEEERRGSEPGDRKMKKSAKPKLIPLELQRLFTNMQTLHVKALTTSDLTSKGFKWTNYEGQVQHDAHELNRLLIDALERSLKHTTGESLCQRLYQGTLVNQTKCLGCNMASERQENYYDILLQVKGHTDIFSSLRDYTAAEHLSGDNKYACDNSSQCLGVKQEAHRSVVLRSLPSILTFSCQRFDLDYSTWQRVKLTSKFKFPLALNMEEFIEMADASARPRQSDEEEAMYINELRRSSGLWIDDIYETALRVADELLESASNLDGYLGILNKITDMSHKDEEFQKIKRKMLNKICINSVKSEENVYELFAIIMHRGTAYSGHYFAYIRDQVSEGVWKGPPYLEAEQQLCKTSERDDAEGNDEIMHLVDKENKKLTIRSETPLHVLIEILQDEKHEKYIISKLGNAVRRKMGTTWNICYGKKYGKIHDFLQRYSPQVFNVIGNIVSLVTDWDIEVRSDSDFATLEVKRNENKNVEFLKSEHEVDPRDSLANVLIHRCFGCFYEFNDSHVKPVTIPETKKAFEGKDSAYLLIYRKSFGTCNVLESKTIHEIQPPPFWMKKAEETNQLLLEQRQAFSSSSGCKLDLQIIFPSNLDTENPPLFPLTNPSKALRITVDTGKKVREVIQSIGIEYQSDIQNGGPNGDEDLALSRLNEFQGYGLHVLSPLENNAYIGDAIYTHPEVTTCGGQATHYLLLWNGRDINGKVIESTGATGAPVNLMLHHVFMENTRTVTTLGSIWVQKATKMSSLCDLVIKFLSKSSSLSGKKFNFSLVERRKDARVKKSNTRGKRSSDGLVGKKYHLLPIYRNGKLLEDVICSNGSERKVKDLSMGEVNNCELYVEDSQGIDLIESEVGYRNTLVPLTIVYNVNNERLRLLQQSQGFGPQAASSDNKSVQNFDVDISHNESVSSLIVKAAKYFSLPTELLQFLTLVDKKENTYNYHQNLSIRSSEIIDNEVLDLELARVETRPQSITIQVCRVVGNDPEITKPTSGGIRMKDSNIELKIEYNETIFSVKNRVIALFMENMDESEKEIFSTSPKRLRTTNWSEEAGPLVEESEVVHSKGKGRERDLRLVSKCIDTVPGLVDKSLLLLEYGEPLIRGVRFINVSLWKPSICRDEPHSSQTKDMVSSNEGLNQENRRKNEKKYSYKGIMLCDMSKEQMLAEVKQLLSKGQRVPAAITDKRKDRKEAEASFASFLKKAGNSDLVDLSEVNIQTETTENYDPIKSKDAPTDEGVGSNKGINVDECDLEASVEKHANCKHLFNAGRVAITPETSLAELYAAVDLLLKQAQENEPGVKNKPGEEHDCSDDRIEDVMAPAPSNSLKALSKAGWKYRDSDAKQEGKKMWSNILIRELRNDFLPGKCHRLQFVRSTDGNIPKDTSPKLRTLNVLSNKTIVVELFPADDVQNGLRFWLCRVENPSDCLLSSKHENRINTLMNPLSPQEVPFEIVVNGGTAPSLGHLKNAIRLKIQDSSSVESSLRMFKYDESKYVWTELKQGEGMLTRGKVPGILQPPLSLKEGDFLCAFEEKTVAGGANKEYIIDRDFDEESRRLAEKKQALSGGKNGNIAFKSKKKVGRNRVEVALSIGDDFDDSSSEKSEEGDGHEVT